MPLKVPHPLEYLFKGHHKCVAKEALGSGLLTPITGAGEQGKVLQKEGGSRYSAGWPQKAAGKSHMR